MKRKTPARVVAMVLVALAGVWVQHLQRPPASEGAAAIAQAHRDGQSGVIVEASGRVVKVLPDDRDGDRHQKFLLRIDGDLTLLVAHNIDLATRAPIAEGDLVSFRGQYEWSDRGGTIHWTHRAPRGNRPGGWIEVGGRRYE